MKPTKKSKLFNHSNYLSHTPKSRSMNDICKDEHISTNTTKNDSNKQWKSKDKLALVVDSTPDPNYNEIEDFVTTRLKQGYDLIDILILAREEFETDKLDNYLYEMRSKGII